MNEADHKRKLVAEINALSGGWARRVEDRWAIGVLDMILKLPGAPIVFAEAKLVVGQAFGPTKRQFIEGQRIAAAGLNVLLIGWKDKRMAISPWTEEADFRQCFNASDDVSTLLEYLRLRGLL